MYIKLFENKSIKSDIISDLIEYKNFVINNIKYDFKSNKIIYKDFSNIDINLVISDLKKKFNSDVIDQINVKSFLQKIDQILQLKKRNTKRKIKEEFDSYIKSINKRFSKDTHFETEVDFVGGEGSLIPRKKYEGEKYNIQIELLKLQEWVILNKKRIAILFEGRDSAGKGSTIKRFIEYLNPKHFRVVVLGLPTPHESKNWLDRYEKHLPKEGEIVFFDRSWYNRAVVEPALGYCSEDQYKEFIDGVTEWEENHISNGLILIKFWFSITKEKQELRFQLRQTSPLKYWKFSKNDSKVLDKWDIITLYKNQMFNNTSSKMSPWVIVNSNDKKIGRLNAMRYVLSTIDYDNKDASKSEWYPEVISIIS